MYQSRVGSERNVGTSEQNVVTERNVGTEQFAAYTVVDVKALPLQSFLPHDKRNRMGYHACMIIFYQLLSELSKFEKQLYLGINQPVASVGNPFADPFATNSDSDDDNDEFPEQVVEFRIRYLTASARRVANIWNNYPPNVKRAWSNRASIMNALPVQGMYMNNTIPITNNINSFLTHTVYEDSTYLF